MKKLEIQVIIAMIILTRSSERSFNPSRYTGIYEKYMTQCTLDHVCHKTERAGSIRNSDVSYKTNISNRIKLHALHYYR